MSSAAFGAVVQEVLAGESARKVAPRAGVSDTQISNMAAGRIPKRATLARFADSLGLSGDLRRRLFTAAGYLDPATEPALA